jgi:hypothetical protein
MVLELIAEFSGILVGIDAAQDRTIGIRKALEKRCARGAYGRCSVVRCGCFRPWSSLPLVSPVKDKVAVDYQIQGQQA